MRRLVLILAFTLAGACLAQAFDAETQGVLDAAKRGKSLPITAVASLMRTSERWCYNQSGASCQWSDIYLDVTAKGATFEVGNAWDERYNIMLTSEGTFRDDRFICETGHDWVQTVRAEHRSDNTPVGGRELFALKKEIADQVDLNDKACFGYVFEGADETAQTIYLLQRKYVDGITDAADDAKVTLHFDPVSAASLTWSW